MKDETPNESYAALVNALLRYLLCISPFRAEGVYYMSHAAPPPLDNTWTCVKSGGHVGWVLLNSAADKGRFVAKPPEGVDPGTIPVVEIPEQYQTGLRIMADKLVAQVGGDARHPQLADLLNRLLAMGDGRFETMALARFLELCRDSKRFPSGLDAYRRDLVRDMCRALCPGYFVGLMSLLLKAISGVEAIVLSGALMSQKATAHLMALVSFALNSILVNDGPERIDRAAGALCDDGAEHLEEAREASRDEVFYGHLFLACPSFYGAKMAYEYLAETARKPDAKERYKKEDAACEEYLVYASTSLMHHFENLNFGWPHWQRHIGRVAEVRRTEGEAAADLKVSEYMDVCLFYPGSYRHALSNGLKPPPETSGTAGGATTGDLCGTGRS